MHIEKLSLINFKNYEEEQLSFSKQVNCLLGKNGSGKTNLMDAIYYMSATKSAFNPVDMQNIRFGESFFAVRGDWIKDDKKYKIECLLQEGSKKILKVNKVEYEKIKEHIGKFPVVLITPYDTDLIREGSEIRRKFVDQIISQVDSHYLDALIAYNRNLKQRNSLLKRFAESGKIDKLLVENYDRNLIDLGQQIFEGRKEFLENFAADFHEQFNQLSGGREQVDIAYQSDFQKEDFQVQFSNAFKKDLVLQRTTLGIHKDEFKFTINKKPLKKFGSQGQQKSFVIALKLAHFQYIFKATGVQPILLLDDIFDKLDSDRVIQLLKIMIQEKFGQVFISDARPDRTKELLHDTGIGCKFYEISGGKIEKVYEEEA